MTLAEFNLLKASEPAFMLYFYNDTCNVCKALWPKVLKLFEEKFPEMKIWRVYVAGSQQLAGQLQMLSVPGVIIFFDGREHFRSSGMIAVSELENKTARPYNLMFF